MNKRKEKKGYVLSAYEYPHKGFLNKMASTILIPLTGHMALAGFLTTFLLSYPFCISSSLNSFGYFFIGKSLFTHPSLNCLGHWLNLPGLTCIFPLTLMIGYGNTKKLPRGSCPDIIFLISTVEKQSDFSSGSFDQSTLLTHNSSLACRLKGIRSPKHPGGNWFPIQQNAVLPCRKHSSPKPSSRSAEHIRVMRTGN